VVDLWVYNPKVGAALQHWVALATFLGIALVAGKLAERATAQAMQIEVRQSDVCKAISLPARGKAILAGVTPGFPPRQRYERRMVLAMRPVREGTLCGTWN